MNTKHTPFQQAAYLLFAGVFILVALGLAGSSDYQEHVILHMSQNMYDSIVSDLTAQNGEKPSDRLIVKEWEKRTGKNK